MENARFLARQIPGAQYAELPGSDHAPWADGDDIIAEIREFVTDVREPAGSGPGGRPFGARSRSGGPAHDHVSRARLRQRE